MIAVEVDILGRVLRALATAAEPEDIMAISSTPEENERIEELAEKNRNGELTFEERFEINQYILAEEYVRLAKVHAYIRIKNRAA